ncbi:MAG: hypothetical protein NVSMB38_44460 [Ktedonobacteraceae bacterium]
MQEQNNPEKINAENPQITSDGASTPILNTNENAWPPPTTREEVVEAAEKEEITPSQHGQTQPTSSTSATSTDDKITSDGASMPILNTNENAWPPPTTRNEVEEAVEKEETSQS